MLELIKTLCKASGVSGDEGEVRDIIRRRAGSCGGEISEDALGNLIVKKKGETGLSVMLCAHMDEVGIIVTGITDDGYIKFACAGGIDRRVLAGKRVFFGRTPGVIGCQAVHLLKGAARDAIPDCDDMYVDIGAENKDAAEKLLSVGDTGAFENCILEFGDGFIGAKALDDRLGCAVLLKLLEEDWPFELNLAFTVQEEVGARGAFAAAFSLKPDIALVIEATTAADIPGVPEGKRVCELGKGGVIPFMDGGAVYDRGLFNMLTKAADREGLSWQTKKYISGGTDAQAVQRSRGGVKTLAISAPVRNLHSPSCVGKISDFESVYALSRLFLTENGAVYGV